MPVTSAPAKTAVRIALPEDVYEGYERAARSYGVTIEEMLQERLISCKGHDAVRSIYFDDAQRQRLGSLLRRNVDSAAQALDVIARMLTVTVEDAKVELSPGLVQRLETRRYKRTLAKLIQEQVVEALERYAGMR